VLLLEVNGLKLTVLQTTLLADGFHTVGTAKNIGVLMATGLELGGTLREAALVNGGVLQEGSTLSSLSTNIVTGMSRDSQTEKADGEGGSKLNHFIDIPSRYWKKRKVY
jgi:hypothetical protein